MKRTIQMTAPLFVLALFVALGGGCTRQAQSKDTEAAVEAAVRDFIAAIDGLDVDAVAAGFTVDATAFYPFSFTPERLDGRDAIRAAQAQGFDLMRSAFEPGEAPQSLNLAPSDLQVRMLGPDAAVVTWHSHRPSHSGRRTSVLERIDGRWLTVSHHASNLPRTR